ncbi:FtsK/SpoIIIE domain-containing protein [Cryobacterium sp. SO1]|uniref:FtsK/SpoIIIE domain-containing protein n=1 Tax=Cryobacterium sp. SO1 TaxID=1897061 RepID=UPI00210C797B|nr:FtsK/SpoIIIE domain-containing protein [Cryobacterium sp. SO1]
MTVAPERPSPELPAAHLPAPHLPASDPIRLPSRPTAPARHGFPLIACVAPLVAAAFIWGITGSALVLVFAVLSPVIAVAGLLDGRRSNSRQRRRDTAGYAAQMIEAESAVDQGLARLRREAWNAAPSVHRILGDAHEPTLWADPATVSVVLGTGDLASGLRLEGGDAEQRELRARAAVLTGAPITVDPAGGIGIVGPGLLIRALARSVVVQLVGQLSPRALGIRAPVGNDWAWTAGLPHRTAASPVCWLTITRAGRPNLPSPPVQPGGPGGDYRITLAETGAVLPPGCATLVWVHGASDAELVRVGGHPAGLRFVPQLLADQQIIGFGAMLHREAEAAGLAGAEATLPETVAFAPLCSGRAAGPGDAPGGLACVIGMGEHGALTVDLVSDGPHALVGGTTGSGKSELLVTWVSALAARYPPSQVTFLLVDFKGGAAFDAVRALPHCVGLITDLDEREALRALASLAAELRHRERVLRDAGGRDITDPRSAGRLPRLVIVVDEFATMLGAFPTLHALFVDIAARGRSLGVHLVLCTQRPAGVMRDALLANCSLRLSLRVNNAADSLAVIGTDAAAGIDAGRPGRCVLRRGSAPAQSCQVATTNDDDIRAVLDDQAVPVSPVRRPWLDPLPPLVTAEQVTAVQVTALAGHLAPSTMVLGLIDEPHLQRYSVAGYDPRADGHLLVVGGAGTGKSTLLAAIAARSAPPAAHRVNVIPADVEASWDALVQARAAQDALAGPAPAGGGRHDAGMECRVLLFDDIDAVLARWGEEHRAAALDLLTGLLRDSGQSGLRLVLIAQRLTGALQGLPALCQSRLVLRLPSVYEHQAAGEPAASYDDTLPPGGGHWRGARIQLLAAPAAYQHGEPAVVPSALSASRTDSRVLLVIAGSTARSAAAIRAAGSPDFPHVVELGAHPAAGSQGGRLEVSDVGAGTVLVGDADTWQAHWSLLSGLRGVAPLVFDGCSLADYRLVTRRRDLPPPLAPASSRGWLVWPDGTVQRVTVP